uniref:Putative secreted protein n=1 Tax=Ixodes ricinus TaxID=34613 RepID=A0A6B0UWF5_IXORI
MFSAAALCALPLPGILLCPRNNVMSRSVPDIRSSVATFLIFFIVRPFGLIPRVVLIPAGESVNIMTCDTVVLFPAIYSAAANIALNSASLTVVPDGSDSFCVSSACVVPGQRRFVIFFFAASVYRASSFGACASHHAAGTFTAPALFAWVKT